MEGGPGEGYAGMWVIEGSASPEYALSTIRQLDVLSRSSGLPMSGWSYQQIGFILDCEVTAWNVYSCQNFWENCLVW